MPVLSVQRMSMAASCSASITRWAGQRRSVPRTCVRVFRAWSDLFDGSEAGHDRLASGQAHGADGHGHGEDGRHGDRDAANDEHDEVGQGRACVLPSSASVSPVQLAVQRGSGIEEGG